MALLDPIDTQAFCPWLEPVTLASVRTAGDVAFVEAPAGCYRITLREAAKSNGVYLAGDVRFTVGSDVVQSGGTPFPPKPRDTVTWGGDVYVVTEVSGSQWLKFWTLTARCPKIAYDLRDTCTIRRPDPAPAADGLRRPGTPEAVASAVDCRLQPEGTEVREVNARFGTVYRYSLFLAGQVLTQAGDYVEVAGVKYEVTGQADVDTLATLTRVSVERAA